MSRSNGTYRYLSALQNLLKSQSSTGLDSNHLDVVSDNACRVSVGTRGVSGERRADSDSSLHLEI